MILITLDEPYSEELSESCRRLGMSPTLVEQGQPLRDFLNSSASKLDDLEFIAATSGPLERAQTVRLAREAGVREFQTLVDPTSVVSHTASIGCGAYVNALSVIGAGVSVGCHANINRSVSIGHHSTIGNFVTIGPGTHIASFCQIGHGTRVGVGAVILPSVKIGENCLIGAGAVVTKDVKSDLVMVGNPARPLRPQPEWKELDSCPNC